LEQVLQYSPAELVSISEKFRKAARNLLALIVIPVNTRPSQGRAPADYF